MNHICDSQKEEIHQFRGTMEITLTIREHFLGIKQVITTNNIG